MKFILGTAARGGDSRVPLFFCTLFIVPHIDMHTGEDFDGDLNEFRMNNLLANS